MDRRIQKSMDFHIASMLDVNKTHPTTTTKPYSPKQVGVG
jgi:hypothetical protein